MSTNEAFLTAVCGECNKRYGVSTAHISGKGGRFACKKCGTMVTVRKTMPDAAVEPDLTQLPDWVRSVERGNDRDAAFLEEAGVFDGPLSGAPPTGAPPSETISAATESSGTLSLEEALFEVGAADPDSNMDTPVSVSEEPTVIREIEATPVPAVNEPQADNPAYRFGLTGKFLLFTLTPLVVISVLSLLYSIDKMLTFQKSTIEASTHIVKGIS